MVGIPCFVNYNTMIVNMLFKYNFKLNDTCTILIIVKYIERHCQKLNPVGVNLLPTKNIRL